MLRLAALAALLVLGASGAAEAATRAQFRSAPRGTVEPRRATGDYCDASDADLPDQLDTEHFRIQYDESQLGSVGIDAYADALEEAWTRHMDEFGWARPPVLPGKGPRLLVRLDALPGSILGYTATNGTYAGFVGDNPASPWNDGDAYASCMVLRNDYGGLGEPQVRGTAAHELHHMVQYGMGAPFGNGQFITDEAFDEGGAKWMEDELLDDADRVHDYLFPDLALPMGEYTGANKYFYWFVFRALTERYGTAVAGGAEDVMQRFWEEMSKGGEQLPAMNAAVAAEGRTLGGAFHDAAVATRFVKPCGGLIAYPFCFEEAAAHMNGNTLRPDDATLSLGARVTRTIADDYSAHRLALPQGGPPFRFTIANGGPSNALRASVACDLGSSLRVVAVGGVLRTGEAATATADPSGCQPDSLVAVVSDGRVSRGNPSTVSTSGYEVATGDAAHGVVTVRVTGPGTVASTPAGIACGSDCSEWFAPGTDVTFTATPITGAQFTGWSGACSGTGACSVTADDADEVLATFVAGPDDGDDGAPPAEAPAPAPLPPGPAPDVPPLVLPPPDRTAPRFTALAFPRTPLRRFLRRGLRIAFVLSEPARVEARLSAGGRLLGRGASFDGSRVTVRVTSRARRRLRRARRVRATLVLTATDAAGNAATQRRRMTLRR
jgi:hypothetical protein